MTVEKRTVNRPVTRYIAFDKEEFVCERDCLEHERQIKAGVAKKRVGALPYFNASPPFSDDEEEWRWYCVRSQEDVEDIAAAFFNADSAAHEFQPKSFPCWVAAILDGREASAGWMIEYSDYAAERKDFDTRLVAEMERLGGGAG